MSSFQNVDDRRWSDTDSSASLSQEEMENPWILFTTAEGVHQHLFVDDIIEVRASKQKRKNRRQEQQIAPTLPVDYDHDGLELQSIDNSSTFSATEDSGISVLETKVQNVLQESEVTAMAKVAEHPPQPPQGLNLMHSSALNSFFLSPKPGQFLTLSPRLLRRSVSDRGLNEIPSSPSPSHRKFGKSDTHSLGGDFYGDSISVINVPASRPELTKKEKNIVLKRNLSQLMSGIYAAFLLMLGGVLYISDQHRDHRVLSEIFSSTIAAVGIVWLIALHVDLCSYKTQVLKQLKEREDAMQEASERFSNATEFIINSGYDMSSAQTEAKGGETQPPPYRFLQGRHSGSFYLKVGMAAFCFGDLIYEGLQLGQHILNFVDDQKMQYNCSKPTSVILHIIVPLYAFYQLFITFKYSNIVINRYKAIARFGMMHLIATCLCFWFSTIVEEAVEDYNHKSSNSTSNSSTSEFDIASFHIIVQKKGHWNNPYHCMADSVLSIRSLKAIPYLYPFAIEYNLLLAGVWYIVWQNIGREHTNSDPHHLRHTISQDEEGCGEIAYQSNLVISADCHASNKGLFLGLFLLLTTIVTVIVFFVAMTTDGFQDRAISIHTSQEGSLTLIGMLTVIVSFCQIRKLDINEHPITFLDDVLLFVPLPFYFVHGIMSIMAEFDSKSYTRLAVHVLVTLQVIVQTPFIIDGLRRCSNSQMLRYKKPGREIITFLIILNLTLWIVNTFELKSVEHYHGQEEYFGDLIWMFIGHTTLPLMLFYRFHSSVCLADMWKSAYEKEA